MSLRRVQYKDFCNYAPTETLPQPWVQTSISLICVYGIFFPSLSEFFSSLLVRSLRGSFILGVLCKFF